VAPANKRKTGIRLVQSNAQATVRNPLVEHTPMEKAHRSAARQGIVQVMSARLLSVIISVGSFVVYSRLLSPKQFGLMAMTNTVFVFVGVFEVSDWHNLLCRMGGGANEHTR
jgi:hypothetical protein